MYFQNNSRLFRTDRFAGIASLRWPVSGGSGAGGYGAPAPNPQPSAQSLPIQQNVDGRPAWVTPDNNHTLYYLDVDTPTGGTCTGGCLGVWLVFVPNADAKAQDGFTIASRSDGTSKQVDYHSHPLYAYSGDGGADNRTATASHLPAVIGMSRAQA